MIKIIARNQEHGGHGKGVEEERGGRTRSREKCVIQLKTVKKENHFKQYLNYFTY